jgi:hypothetical protein
MKSRCSTKRGAEMAEVRAVSKGTRVADEDLDELVEDVREATRALIQGRVRRYFALVNHAPDYTLMPPTGGPTRHGSDERPETVEALEEFFAGPGDGDFELERCRTPPGASRFSWGRSGNTARSAAWLRTGRCG